MKDISGSVGVVTSLRKYHGKIMEIVNKRSKSPTSTTYTFPQNYPSYEKVYYSSTENVRTSSTDSYSADGEYTSNSSHAQKIQRKKIKELHFSDEINTVYIDSTSPYTSSSEFVSSTPTSCKAKFLETPTLQKVKIIENRKQQNEKGDKNSLHARSNKICTVPVEPRTVKNQRNSTQFYSKHEDEKLLSKKELDSLKIIQKTDWSELKIPNSVQNNTFVSRYQDDKFVVNLFESRASKRWKRKSLFDDEIASKKKSDCRTLSSITVSSENTSNNTPKNYKSRSNTPKSVEVASKKKENILSYIPTIGEHLNSNSQKIQETPSDTKSNEEILSNAAKIHETVVSSKDEHFNNSTLEEYKNSEEYQKFLRLKKLRDIECLKLTEASNALRAIKKNSHRNMTDELLAETILLESVEKEKLLLNEIRKNSDSKVTSTKHTGSLEISNLEFKLTSVASSIKKKIRNFSEFYVLTADYGTKLSISQTKQVDEENILKFPEPFVFENVREDFQIRLQLFSIQLRPRRDNIFRKRFCHCCPTSKVLYANVNTCEYQERIVLNPAFKPFAELTLTKTDLEKSSFTFKNLMLNQQSAYMLANENNATLSFKVKEILVNSTLSGFMTFGTKKQGSEAIFWERKWCVLNGTRLSIYNYPSEQDFSKPLVSINLKYCFGPIFSKLSNPPRKRAFVIKTGHPSMSNSTSMSSSANKLPTLKSKPNFLLDKFYFSADTQDEYIRWTKEIKSVLDFFGSWKMLFFNDEYYEYMKNIR